MKYLKVLQPVLPKGITVVSTTWKVNESKTMDGVVRLSVDNDTVNLFTRELGFEINDDEILYGQITFTLSDGTLEKSNILELRKHGNVEHHSLYVFPPKVSYKINGGFDKNIEVEITPPMFYKNSGVHKSTTWTLKDTNGIPFFSRKNDVENLLSIKIDDSEFKNKQLFTIEAIYHFDIDDIEVCGRANVSLSPNEPTISLSKHTLSPTTDNVINVIGYDITISSLTATVIIDGVKKQPVLITSIHNNIDIPANTIGDENEVKILFKQSSFGSTSTFTSTLIALRDMKEKIINLNKNADIITIPLNTMYNGGIAMKPLPMKNGKFLITENLNGDAKSTIYEIKKSTLIKIDTHKPHTGRLFISNDLDLWHKGTKNLTPVNEYFDLVTDDSVKIDSVNNVGVTFFERDIYYVTTQNQIGSVDIETKKSTIKDTFDPSFEDIIYVEDKLFMGSSNGHYKFKTNSLQIITGQDSALYRFVQYIPAYDGIVAVCYKDDQIDFKYITFSSIQFMKSITINSNVNTPNVVYDITNNKIFIVGKGLV